jgi:hypothetical protein
MTVAPNQYVWKLRGEAVFASGTWNVTSGQGGFSADIDVGAAGLGDDQVTWALDGVVTGPT